MPAALYLAVELGAETEAARLWWWSAAPGPSRPDARTVPIREGQLDSGALAELAAALRPSPVRQAPAIGATVIESLASGGLVVSGVEPGSPAELAGLAAGQEFAALRDEVGTEFESWEAAAAALRPGRISPDEVRIVPVRGSEIAST